jgi:hypothetical protein
MPIVIARHMDRTDIPTIVVVRCVDQKEYSLMKILFVYIIIVEAEAKKYTKVLDSLASSLFFQ